MVPKSDPRIDACGAVDELNAWLGYTGAQPGLDSDVRGILAQVQSSLLALGARLADPSGRIAARLPKAALTGEDVKRLENWIDRFDDELPQLRRFILPGGSAAGAALHVARAVCRRAEGRIVALGPGHADVDSLAFVNRLSDLLFVLARALNKRAGLAEAEW